MEVEAARGKIMVNIINERMEAGFSMFQGCQVLL